MCFPDTEIREINEILSYLIKQEAKITIYPLTKTNFADHYSRALPFQEYMTEVIRNQLKHVFFDGSTHACHHIEPTEKRSGENVLSGHRNKRKK